MSNTLTALAADLYKAADMIAREQVGFLTSVTMNSDALKKVALNDTVRSFFTRPPTVNSTFVPAMTIPEGTDQVVDNKTMSITQIANVQIPWTGEDIAHVDNGSGFTSIYGDQILQAMRAITNKIEKYVGVTVKNGASRAWGTAGTAPFASNFNEVANLRKILVDNGCPMDGQVTLVIDSTAGTNLRNLPQLQKGNEAGGTEMLRQGTLLNLQDIRFKESAGVALHSPIGTGASYQANGASIVGATSIPVGTGSGTVLTGDIVTFAGDTNKYVNGAALAAGNLTLNAPGLVLPLSSTVAATLGAVYRGNVAFHKNAVEVVVRAPKMPPDGDAAVDRMTVQDPYSGLIYEIAVYKGYGKMMIDITTFFDAKVWKPEFVATLLG